MMCGDQMPASGGRVLVTGGSRGIGRAVVLECARRGADVAFTYSTAAGKATEVAEDARRCGGTISTHRYQTGDESSARALHDELQRGGPIDAIVLNAGIWEGGRLDQRTPSDWWRVVETNLGGTYEVLRSLLPLMQHGPSSSITLISSVVGLTGFPGDTAYAASKGALLGFGRSLAKELGTMRTRVNVLAPGFVSTDMTDAVGHSARNRITDRIILGRFGEADEIAKAVAFLVFDATYMTGSVLVVDGGWSI